MEIPTIWKIPVTKHSLLHRGKRGTRQLGILFSKTSSHWTFIIMVQELEQEEAEFCYVSDRCSAVNVNLSRLIGHIMRDFRNEYYLSTFACDVMYGWNEYLAEVRSYVAQVVVNWLSWRIDRGSSARHRRMIG